MRVEVDQKKLEEKMQKKGIKNLKQLAELCGISETGVQQRMLMADIYRVRMRH